MLKKEIVQKTPNKRESAAPRTSTSTARMLQPTPASRHHHASGGILSSATNRREKKMTISEALAEQIGS